MRVLVAGASGFVGSRLCPALVGDGHEVRAMTRHPDSYDGAGTAVHGDVADLDSLIPAMDGVDAAYYLVHSLDRADFADHDARAARNFATAAAKADVQRIIYLGGLGEDDDDLSEHLRSRREVESLLADTGVPVTVLRAGIIIGHGGISWEMTRQLVHRLPAMVTPRWVGTRTQPIAADDVVRYLVAVLDPRAAGQVFDIGGPEIMTYEAMMRRLARLLGKPLFIVPVPVLSPKLSSWWLGFVTDVDATTGRALVDSMTNEVVVTHHGIRDIADFKPMSYEDAVLLALRERRESLR